MHPTSSVDAQPRVLGFITGIDDPWVYNVDLEGHIHPSFTHSIHMCEYGVHQILDGRKELTVSS
jgi:hypothetical protein